jgi:hypothetical protein
MPCIWRRPVSFNDHIDCRINETKVTEVGFCGDYKNRIGHLEDNIFLVIHLSDQITLSIAFNHNTEGIPPIALHRAFVYPISDADAKPAVAAAASHTN